MNELNLGHSFIQSNLSFYVVFGKGLRKRNWPKSERFDKKTNLSRAVSWPCKISSIFLLNINKKYAKGEIICKSIAKIFVIELMEIKSLSHY